VENVELGRPPLNGARDVQRDAVAKWLAFHDVDEKRLTTVGYGARRPLAPNGSESHRAQNRRTEYYVEELDGKKVDPAPTASSVGTTSSGGRTRQ
jgi:hypothetical protein